VACRLPTTLQKPYQVRYGSCKVSESRFFGADETGLKKIKTVIIKLSKKHLAFITLLSVCICAKNRFSASNMNRLNF
jgi:hypothetical protein